MLITHAVSAASCLGSISNSLWMNARIYIRSPGPEDAASFLQAVRQSRALHRGWVTPCNAAGIPAVSRALLVQ
jgi:hypothetical protein